MSKKDDSRSTSKLLTHRSMTRLNMNTSASRLESRLDQDGMFNEELIRNYDDLVIALRKYDKGENKLNKPGQLINKMKMKQL